MKPRKFFPPLILVVVLLASCAPQPIATASVDPLQVATQVPESQSAQPSAAAENPVQGITPLAVATSRGDKLEATDPATVSLASGGIQLVEFFRFT